MSEDIQDEWGIAIIGNSNEVSRENLLQFGKTAMVIISVSGEILNTYTGEDKPIQFVEEDVWKIRDYRTFNIPDDIPTIQTLYEPPKTKFGKSKSFKKNKRKGR